MRGIEVTLWQDEREYKALQSVLARNGTTVEAEMQERLAKLYRQTVPLEEQMRISETIRAGEVAEAQRWDLVQPISAFHITERGQEHWLRRRERTEFLHAAAQLRRFFTTDPKYRPASFADMLSRTDTITPEQFRHLALERMENTGRVTGAFDINLVKGEFSMLHIMDGWKTYRFEDVSAAVYNAMRKALSPDDERWRLFLDRLEGRELMADTPKRIEVQGSRRLLPEDIILDGTIDQKEDLLNFHLASDFQVDEVFGTHVVTGDNDNYLVAYANYDMAAGEARDELEITLCREDGADIQLAYMLDADERAALLGEMREYCQQQTGQSLEDLAATLRMADSTGQQMM